MKPVEHARLSRQCRAILTRLREGPVANTELASMALKYTSRISDLRVRGYQVECYDRDATTGVAWYRLRTTTPRQLGLL